MSRDTGRVRRAVTGAARQAVGLVVDDGLVGLGVIVAVAAAALLARAVGFGDLAGWALFALVWAALALSLWRARPSR